MSIHVEVSCGGVDRYCPATYTATRNKITYIELLVILILIRSIIVNVSATLNNVIILISITDTERNLE